jgi:hypothetical protein
MRENVEELAAQLGLSYDEALSLMSESLGIKEPQPQTLQSPQPQTLQPLIAPTPQETIEIGGKEYEVIKSEIVNGKEHKTIIFEGKEVILGDEVEDTSDKVEDMDVKDWVLDEETGEWFPVQYDFRKDDRLTEKAKRIFEKVILFSETQAGIQYYKEHRGTIAFQIALPEAIRRSEEAGFPTYGVVIPKVRRDEHTFLHELAHALDAGVNGIDGERLSSDPAWEADAQKYMREYEPEYPYTKNIEWFAILFERSVTGSREVPDYIEKWFEPYIK